MNRTPAGVAPSGASGARSISNVELADTLCRLSDKLSEARRIHLRAYGCLLPHVFMGDVLKRIGGCLGTEEAKDIMAALESGMVHGDRETRNVISLSFTRDSELESFFDKLRPLMGPSTRAQLNGR